MLTKTKSSFLQRMAGFFTGALKDDFYDELEEMCIRDRNRLACPCAASLAFLIRRALVYRAISSDAYPLASAS